MKWFKSCLLIVAVGLLAVWLMPMLMPEENLVSVNQEFKTLAVNMTIFRLLIIGLSGVLFWPLISKLVMRYLSFDVSRYQVRIMAWYVCTEAAILGSFWGAF